MSLAPPTDLIRLGLENGCNATGSNIVSHLNRLALWLPLRAGYDLIELIKGAILPLWQPPLLKGGPGKMANQLMKQGFSIVMLGQFNPIICQPQWFSAHKLLRQQEADAAKINVIHPDVAIFEAEWVQLHVTRNRYQLSTYQPPFFPALSDLALGTFSILEHTPIWMLGINSDYHYRFDSTDEWHAFGNAMAPKPRWDGLLKKPGMLSLEMKGERGDGPRGYIRVRVEPSAEYNPGVYISVNDHFESAQLPDKAIGCSEIMGILASEWKRSQAMTEDLSKRLLKPAGDM